MPLESIKAAAWPAHQRSSAMGRMAPALQQCRRGKFRRSSGITIESPSFGAQASDVDRKFAQQFSRRTGGSWRVFLRLSHANRDEDATAAFEGPRDRFRSRCSSAARVNLLALNYHASGLDDEDVDRASGKTAPFRDLLVVEVTSAV